MIAWFRRRLARDTPAQPSTDPDRIRLIAGEVGRELSVVSSSQANAVQRAALVLAASGITVFSAPALTTSGGWLTALIAAVAAGCAMAAITLWRSKSMSIDRDVVAAWLQLDASVLEARILADMFEELVQARRDLDKKNARLQAALAFLMLAWISSIVLNYAMPALGSLTGET